MIEYTISNYIDDNRKEPIKDWLKSLDGTTRKRILLRFYRLKDGKTLEITNSLMNIFMNSGLTLVQDIGYITQ